MEAARRWRRGLTGKLVMTNGVFDVLHRGHALLLARARAEGDALLVAVNTDASARRLAKGPNRPVNTERDRALLVAALESVDAVVLFGEETPQKIIEALEPDVLVKGADYRLEDIVGAEFVTKKGGRVVRVPLEEGYSTTDLLKKASRGSS